MIVNRRNFLGGVLLAPLIVAGCGESAPSTGKTSTTGRQRLPARDLRALDEFLKQQAAADRFSGGILIAAKGQTLLRQGYGMADRGRGIANTARTGFCIASMGKMFTAVATAQLVQQRKLAFTDTIGRHLPEFGAPIGGKVTVHHLLTHTAGMADVGKPESEDRTVQDWLKRIVKEPLRFEPGSQHVYSNAGFIVLGAIIERVSGQSYHDYIPEHILKPAGMSDTGVRSYRPKDVPNMAHGYALPEDARQPPPGRQPGPPRRGPAPPPGSPDSPDKPDLRDTSTELKGGSPAGGAYSTVDDMHRFAQALTGHRLLNPALTDTITTGKVKSNRPGGSPDDMYAYGFGDTRVNGARVIGHNGGTTGYEANLDIYPGTDHTIIILANQDRVIRPVIEQTQDLLKE